MTETSSHPPGSPGEPLDPPSDEAPAQGVPVEAIPVPEAEPVADTEPVAEAPTVPVASDSGFRMAIVTSVTVDLPVQHPTVVLRETESPRRQLSFSVGLQDGIAISHGLRRIPTPRPLTHELVADVLQAFDIDVVAVRLVGRQGTTYFAELDLRGPNGRSVHSCRPSDAVAIALRQPVPVPILIDSRLFEVLGDVPPP
jgi:bifunctional DNase/RNase